MKRIFYNIKSMFKSSSKTRRNLLLTVVALIEVLLIGIVSTFAWVETISSLAIKTDPSKKSSIAAGAPLSVANVDNNSSTPIDLTQYFRASGNVHLASASSADGENVFFKNLGAGNSSPAYRKGNINDINVNYISFSFKIKASTKDRDFCFEQAPNISIGGNSDVPVRMAISTDTEKTPKVFSIEGKSDEVITDTSGEIKTSQVHSFADYSQTGDKNIFTIKGNNSNTETEVFVSLWLEDLNCETSYTGDLSIQNLKIICPVTLTVHVITNGKDSVDGGNVTVDETNLITDENNPYSHRVDITKSTVTLAANVTDPNNYKFDGWYSSYNTSTNTGTPLSGISENSGELSVTSSKTIYAVFKEKFTVTLTPDPSVGGYVGFEANPTSSISVTKNDAYYGDKVTAYARDNTNSNYEFDGWYPNRNGGGTKKNGNPYTFTVKDNVTLFAHFIKYPLLTIERQVNEKPSKVGGTVTMKYNNTTTSMLSTQTQMSDYIKPGSSVTLTASPSSGYTFKGWYKSDNTNWSNTNRSITVTVNSNIIYYACFIKPTTVNIYITPRAGWDSYYLHVRDSHNTTYGSEWNEARFDSDTGYFKYSFTTDNQDSFYAKLGDSLPDLTISATTVSIGSTINKIIKANDTVATKYDNDRCIWFIDNVAGGGYIQGDCDNGDTMQARLGSSTYSYYTMTNIKSKTWIAELNSSNSTTIRFRQLKSDKSEHNFWQTSIPSNKNQFTATGWADIGQNISGSGTWS